MHKCNNCGLTYGSVWEYRFHRVCCEYMAYAVVALLVFFLYARVVAAIAAPCPGGGDDCEMWQVAQVYLPLVIEGEIIAIGDGPVEPTATGTPTPTPSRTPIPIDWRTPRAR